MSEGLPPGLSPTCLGPEPGKNPSRSFRATLWCGREEVAEAAGLGVCRLTLSRSACLSPGLHGHCAAQSRAGPQA